MCNRRSLRYVNDLSYADFRFMLGQLPPSTMRRITCEGPGEPLLNQDLLRMFAYAKKKGFITHTFTNATLISAYNVNDLLTVLDEITISIDGATKGTYEKIRQGASFRKVIDNTKLLTSTKRRTGACTKIIINFVCNQLNFHETEKMVLLAHRLGVNHLKVTPLREMFAWKDNNEYANSVRKLHVETRPERLLTGAYSLASRLGIDFCYHAPKPTFPRCSWPFRACFVTQDGFVTPCCLIPDPDVMNFGNVFHQPLKEIWNGHAYMKFRERFIHMQPAAVCGKCVT